MRWVPVGSAVRLIQASIVIDVGVSEALSATAM
jgi:hypothetical protein